VVSAQGLCLAFAAGWERTQSPQLSQRSAIITHHLPAASQPHEGKHYPHFAGRRTGSSRTNHTTKTNKQKAPENNKKENEL